MGTCAEAKRTGYIEGDIYRLWSFHGCFLFRYGTSYTTCFILGSNGSGTISYDYLFYPEGYDSGEVYITSSQLVHPDYTGNATVDHWVSD